MSDIPDYSIIIPTHNSSSYVSRLFQSVPIRGDLEVIVVDDHSSPEESASTCDALRAAGFPQSKFMRNIGRGAGAARNLGLSVATGKWFIFADSDDLFTDLFDQLLNEYAASDCDTVLFMPTEISDGVEASRLEYCQEILDSGHPEDLGYLMSAPWSRIIRAEVVARHGLRFSDTLVSNDILFVLQSYYYSNTVEIDARSIYCLVNRPGSLWFHRHSQADLLERVAEQVQATAFLRHHLDEGTFKRVVPEGSSVLKLAFLSRGISGVASVVRAYRGSGVPIRREGRYLGLLRRTASLARWKREVKAMRPS